MAIQHETGPLPHGKLHPEYFQLLQPGYREQLLKDAKSHYPLWGNSDYPQQMAQAAKWFNSDEVKSARIILLGSLLHLSAPTFLQKAQAYKSTHERTYDPQTPVTAEFLSDVGEIILHIDRSLSSAIYKIYAEAQKNTGSKEAFTLAEAIFRTGEASHAVSTASITDAIDAASKTFKQFLPLVLPVLAQDEGHPVSIGTFLERLEETQVLQVLAKGVVPTHLFGLQQALRKNAAGEMSPKGFSSDHFSNAKTRRGPTLSQDTLDSLKDTNGRKITENLFGIPSQSIFGCIIFIPENYSQALNVTTTSQKYGTFHNLLLQTTANLVKHSLLPQTAEPGKVPVTQ